VAEDVERAGGHASLLPWRCGRVRL
jgi:hypothetical protein